MNKRPIKHFLFMMKSRKFIISIIVLILMNIFASYFSLIPAYLTQIIFDKVIANFNLKFLFIIIFLLLLFFLVNGFLTIINTSFYVKILNSSSLNFRNKYLSSYLSKDFTSLSTYSEGDIIYRGNNDIQNICELSFELIIKTLTQFIFLIGILFLMFKSSLLLSICVIVLMAVEYFYNLISSNTLKNKVIKVKDSDSNVLEIYKQIINRYVYIRLNRLQKQESARFNNVITEALKNRESYILNQSILSGVTNLISGSRQMVVIAVGAYLISKGELSIGILIAFNQLVQSLASPTQFFSNLVHYYKDLLASHERVEEIMHTTSLDNYQRLEDQNIKLICRNINLTINEIKLINDLNLTVYSKEKVAIIGESGSGKSSLCKLIAGLYRYEGEIFLGEGILSNAPVLGFMLDESTMFRGSLWDNITYGLNEEQANIDCIRDALRMVKLDYLYDQTEGLRSVIDKNSLSKGEKQRIELARIILLKPDLIILDEPTSGLDELTEKIVWDSIRKECKNSTILYTTHKKGIIYGEDRILELKRGSLIEHEIKVYEEIFIY